LLSGAGVFDGFKGIFSSNGLNTNVAQGILIGTAKQFQDLINSKVLAGPNPGFDLLDSIFHPGTQYRGGNDIGPDPHLSYDPKLGGEPPFHFDRAYPYSDLVGFGEHWVLF